MIQRNSDLGTDPRQASLDPLTARELEVLHYIAKGWSDREIAQKLFLSLNTIKWHNRQMYSKLGVPNRRQAVALASQAGILAIQPKPSEPVTSAPKHNLPAQVTSFVGREAEVAELTSLLESARLLTLTGTGGVGKTRLSIQVAKSALRAKAFDNGAYFIDLAPISNPSLIGELIADVLAIPEDPGGDPVEAIKRFLQDRKLLLVMDNFEHLLEAAPLVSELLKALPNLKVLATSRESLKLSGEHVYVISPLGLAEGIELFQQRARAVKSDIEFDDPALEAIERISARLDGLPLAIEIAAARMVLLSPQALLPQLENRLDTLRGKMRDAPERQQTLRATLDWSYALLDSREKNLFNRLGVFMGGCSLEAIEAVCDQGDSIDLFDGLEALLNKSLLLKDDDWEGEPNFTLLETLREYALEKLAESEETELTRARHAEYYASLAEKAAPALKNISGSITMWANRIEQAFDNLRAAFFWSMAGDVMPGLRIVNALDGLWWYTHRAQQGNRWINLALEKSSQASPVMQAQTLIASGSVALTAGDWELSRERGLEALSILRKTDDRWNLAFVLGRLGTTDLNTRRFASAEIYLTESLQLYEQLGDTGGSALILNAYGELMRMQKRYEEAKAYYEKSIAMRREAWGEEGSAASYNLANIERHLGNDESASELYKNALDFSLRANHIFLACAALMGIAGIMAVEGSPIQAARLLGATEAILESYGHSIQPTDREDYERSAGDARARLDEATFEAAWTEGRAMTLEQAVKVALQEK